ncbi:hypothetical protein M0P65_07545 [Candidatus Gracilibacteria bacterium]|nr:hypothetical protein [Candidatus Gracilibacteria bacterium]
MKIPEKITLENMFVKKEDFEDTSENVETIGILNSNSKVLFHPTESELDDQCFNLNMTLDAFILPRLIYYRDNCPSQLICINNTINKYTEQVEKQENTIFNEIILGFWLAVNAEERTEEITLTIKRARELLAQYWNFLWC